MLFRWLVARQSGRAGQRGRCSLDSAAHAWPRAACRLLSNALIRPGRRRVPCKRRSAGRLIAPPSVLPSDALKPWDGLLSTRICTGVVTDRPPSRSLHESVAGQRPPSPAAWSPPEGWRWRLKVARAARQTGGGAQPHQPSADDVTVEKPSRLQALARLRGGPMAGAGRRWLSWRWAAEHRHSAASAVEEAG